ncbi:MAG: hypothetical protein V3T00_01935 [bacterium]
MPDSVDPLVRPLHLKDVAFFFLPLAFTAELMMVSHTIIHASLARWESPTESLAAFSIALSFHTIVSSPTVVAPFTMLSYLKDRGSAVQLFRFHGVLMLAPMAVTMLVALTPLGDWIFQYLLGASPAVAAQARQATFVLAWVHPLIALRSMANAVFMLNRRTIMITCGTLVRLLGLAAVLATLAPWLGGAAGGALSLVGCIFVETVFMLYLARRFLFALPPRSESPVTQREVWAFAWPLMISQMTEGSLAFAINVFIGRLAKPDLALAAFGVVRGLAMLLLSPLRNLAHTAQALVHGEAERKVMVRFTAIAVLTITTAILLLFWSPLRPVVLEGVMGLTGELNRYSIAGVQTIVLVPLFWGYAALFRGLLSAIRRTKAIGFSAALKLSAVVAAGSVTLVLPEANGTVVGIVALAAAFGSESLFLGWRLYTQRDPEAGPGLGEGRSGARSTEARGDSAARLDR